MDSQRSGHSCDLIHIKAPKVILTIKGPTCHPKLINKDMSEEWTAINVRCKDEYAITVYGSDTHLKVHPLFFEQQNYEIIIQSDSKSNLEFWHENLTIREKISDVDLGHDSSISIKTGVINFKGNIGYSDLTLLIDGKEYLTVTIEVFPVKLDYQKDYITIMDDLTKELYNLIFEFLRETYRNYRFGSHHANSLVEFLEIIKHIYSDYINAVEAVIYQPHHILQTNHEIVRTNKAKRIDSKSVRWLEKHSREINASEGNIQFERVMAVRKVIVYDTRENQLVKFILQSTSKRLNEFKRNYMMMDRVKNNGPDQKGVLEPINKMISGINNKLSSSFLGSVSPYKGQGQLSLVFSMAPGYRELYAYYMILQHGLDLSGGILHMSLKDLADMYEYWCFVKLNSILSQKYHLTSKELIRTNRKGLFVTLVKNKQKSTVKYKTDSGDSITLAYNASGKYPTGPQKPDNTLSLSKCTADGVKKYQYVFDAKYKMNPAVEGSYYYNHISKTPGPEEEDINTMHRYRDAIVSQHEKEYPWERLMFGAYVLFPLSGSEENIKEYKNHMFYKSVKDVNIGGLPFLPSSTELVEELLRELVDETASEADTRPPVQKNSAEILDLYNAVVNLNADERKALKYALEYNDEKKSFTVDFVEFQNHLES